MKFNIGDVITNGRGDLVSIGYIPGIPQVVAVYWIKQNVVDFGIYGKQTIEDVNLIYSGWRHVTMEDLA